MRAVCGMYRQRRRARRTWIDALQLEHVLEGAILHLEVQLGLSWPLEGLGRGGGVRAAERSGRAGGGREEQRRRRIMRETLQ